VDDAPKMNAAAPPRWLPVVDASDLPVMALEVRADTTLGQSLRQQIASLDDPDGVISAFGSFIADR